MVRACGVAAEGRGGAERSSGFLTSSSLELSSSSYASARPHRCCRAACEWAVGVACMVRDPSLHAAVARRCAACMGGPRCCCAVHGDAPPCALAWMLARGALLAGGAAPRVACCAAQMAAERSVVRLNGGVRGKKRALQARLDHIAPLTSNLLA
jgi:hypothetical protein